MKEINLLINPSTYEKIKEIADSKKTSVTKIIILAINQYIKTNNRCLEFIEAVIYQLNKSNLKANQSLDESINSLKDLLNELNTLK